MTEMLKYLIEFDPKNSADLDSITDSLNQDIDINDKTILQDQFNNVRKSQFALIKMYDQFQGDLLRKKSKLNAKTRELLLNVEKRAEISKIMQSDPEIIELKEVIEALEMSMKTISNAIDIAKSDLRILQSSMYNK